MIVLLVAVGVLVDSLMWERKNTDRLYKIKQPDKNFIKEENQCNNLKEEDG